MMVSRRDLERAVFEGVISSGQAEELWRVFGSRGRERAGFDLPHVAYYFGALVVISAMTWFMTLGWELFGGGGMLAISLVYAALFAGVGGWLRRSRPDLRVPGGLLVTAAVCMTPLAVYGFERVTGLWLGQAPGNYRGFYEWVKGSWFPMELGTVAAGLIALRYVRFPFLTAPVAFALWFMSMDLNPLIYGGSYLPGDGYGQVSLVFGLAVLVCSFLVDRRTREDYAFWGYLFGMLAFWGGLGTLGEGGEPGWFVYGLINLALIPLSVLLDRRVFIVFGSLGVFGYVGHLAWEVFEDSLAFPFVLSGVGLATIALGVLYARNRWRVERAILGLVPQAVRSLLPPGR